MKRPLSALFDLSVMPAARRLLVLSGALFLLHVMPVLPLRAAEVELHSETLLRYFERDLATGATNRKAMPAYQYLQLDAGSLQERGLSFHLYGWGRYDLAGNNVLGDNEAGELLYGYVQFSKEEHDLNLRAGRQYLFEGVARDSIDGVRLSAEPASWLGLSLFAGQPVALDSTNGRGGDAIYGGRLVQRLTPHYSLGFSYKHIRNDSSRSEEVGGIDFSLFLPANLMLSGFSSYNLLSDGWGEHSYELFWSSPQWSLRPYVQVFDFGDYFTDRDTTPPVFRLLALQDDETLTSVGADLSWRAESAWEAGGKVKSSRYDMRDDKAIYYAALLIWHGSGLTQAGGELGRSQGNSDPTSYWLVRLFFYKESLPGWLPVGFVTADLVYAHYDQRVFGESSSLFTSLGTGRRFLDDALELKLSADYSSDPFFDDDLRALAVLSWRYQKF